MIKIKAYSLLELSIVLTVIAMIIAVITSGQNLLNNAKLYSVIKEIQTLSSAIATFKDKYGQYPGDMDNAKLIFGTSSTKCSSGICDENGFNIVSGNGNGLIDGFQPNNQENLSAFQELGLSSLIAGIYSGLATTSLSGATAGINVPGSKYNNSAIYYLYGSNIYGKFANGNSIIITNNPFASDVDNPIVTVSDAYLIDSKIDDGLPYNGKIIGYNNIAANNCVATTISSAVSPYNNYKYLTSGKTLCIMNFALGDYVFQ